MGAFHWGPVIKVIKVCNLEVAKVSQRGEQLNLSGSQTAAKTVQGERRHLILPSGSTTHRVSMQNGEVARGFQVINCSLPNPSTCVPLAAAKAPALTPAMLSLVEGWIFHCCKSWLFHGWKCVGTGVVAKSVRDNSCPGN